MAIRAQSGARPDPRGNRRSRTPTGLDRLSDEFTALAQKVSQSVVRIEAKGLATGQGPGGSAMVARARSLGSGVLVDAEGYLIADGPYSGPVGPGFWDQDR